MNQNVELKHQMNFNNQMQLYENMYNIAYIPIQYYPQVYPIISQNNGQNLNFNMFEPTFNFGESFLFY